MSSVPPVTCQPLSVSAGLKGNGCASAIAKRVRGPEGGLPTNEVLGTALASPFVEMWWFAVIVVSTSRWWTVDVATVIVTVVAD